jgi:DNA-binding CsgD family transcriptional regulator
MERLFYSAAEQGTETTLPQQDAVVSPGPCRVVNRTHGGTVAIENQSDRLMSTRRLRVSVPKGRRPPLMRPAPPSVGRPFARSSSTPDGVALAHAVLEVRRALEDVVVASAEVAARANSVAEALASLSGEEVSPVLLGSSRTPGADPALSPRERDVLALIVAGQTNKAIAEALYVSPNTVKTHVSSLLHKLQADTRVQLAAIATRQRLY